MSAAESLNPSSSLWTWLAYDLRRYRMRHGLSQPQLGRLIGAARQTVCNYEAGVRRITDEQARVLDTTWQTDGHFHRLLTFARLNHDPDWMRQYSGYEARATMLKIYEGQWVPGLLQTPGYAQACLMAGRAPNVDDLVASRMARQEVLSKSAPPEVWALIDEGVLARPVGGLTVMRDQLSRLLELADLPNVSLRVVPWTAGAHPGMDGAFKVITVQESDVAFVEAPGGGRLILEASEVRSFGVRYDRIGAKALPEDSSRSRIVQAMETMK